MLHRYSSSFFLSLQSGFHFHVSLIQVLVADKEGGEQSSRREAYGDNPYFSQRCPESFNDDLLFRGVERSYKKNVGLGIASRKEVGS